MPFLSWHILCIGRELHTCNSKCFCLTLHLAVSIEASQPISVWYCQLWPLRQAFFWIVSWRGGRWGRGQESENNADQNSDLGYRYLYCYKCIQYFLKEKQVSIFKTVEGGQRRREVSTQASKVTAIDSETWGIRGEGLLLLMHCKQRKRRKEGTGEKVKV